MLLSAGSAEAMPNKPSAAPAAASGMSRSGLRRRSISFRAERATGSMPGSLRYFW